MPPEAFPAAASRLCTACGVCCDGTMFQIVRMQPGDSPAELGRLGLKIRCRDGEFFMEQPCAALSERRCTVYEKRPVRCRLFHCQQLRRVESGDADEEEAMNLILETRGMVEQVRSLIEQCGLREDGRSLTERFERVMSTPVNETLEPEMAAVRENLEGMMRKLKMQLNHEFRPPPGAP
jgi:Fe-S-cluster containining protein